MKWKTVCTGKDKGKLGVNCLSSLNKALLCWWNVEGGWYTRDGRVGEGMVWGCRKR